MLSLLSSSEFWSAIAGAVVGGIIAFGIQWIALRETRKATDEQQKFIRQSLAHSLLFKMLRINSNILVIKQHFDECDRLVADRDNKGEPWQYTLPIANLPAEVHFSSDEMGMLLSLKHDEVFNVVLSMDAVHNSLMGVLMRYDIERNKLVDMLHADSFEGTAASGSLTEDQLRRVRPTMINANQLAEAAKHESARDAIESTKALASLGQLLKEELSLRYSLVPSTS